MPKIKNKTSGQHQILLRRQGSYGCQIPKSIFTLTHRGRHRRPKRDRFAPKRDLRGGPVLPERKASVLGSDAVQASRAGPGCATRDGATTLCNCKNCGFSSYYYSCHVTFFRRLSPPRVFAPHTRDVCQIDRLYREWCASILLRDKLCSLIDINLLVN